MIDCPVCGTPNEDDRKFCGECGSGLTRACGVCGTPNPASVKFCGECGTRLDEASPEPQTIPLQAERRLVTVLFADLTGFTTFSEGRDPEDVRSMLTGYFDRSREVVESFGGVVDKFIGDAVMAVWGAVRSNDDDAERAVRAGLELVDAVAKMALDQGSPDLALRVGVLTGEAAVGPGGNDKGLVVGDLVNTASRLQSIAEPGTVLVGEPTMRASSAAIAFQPLGDQTVKGKSIPVSAYRVEQILSEVGGRGRAGVLEPPFVGRSDELRLLKDLRESVGRDKRARHVSIVGEGGIGKSRLAWEFQKYADGLVETTYWHQGRSPAYGDGVAFWAVKEMIHRRAGILETDSDDDALAALDQALEEFLDAEDAAWVRPRLHAVLGVGPAPSGSRSELDSAVRLFFQGVARRAPVVMVFEDLQWADPGVLDFVEDLTEWSRDHPILVVSLARPELLDRRPDWGTKGGTMSLRLAPLPPEDMRRLVEGAMPDLGPDTVDIVVERSGGVPLFAVELLRGISEGSIDKTIPETIQAAIGARLDRLAPGHRALAQDAAILGQSFTIEALTAVADIQAHEVHEILEELSKSQLVEPVRDPRSPERGQYRFVQSMIQEVAASRLNREAKRQRHLAAAHYLLERDDPELAAVVADHFLQAYNASPSGEQSDELKAEARGTLLEALRRAEEVRSYEQVLSTGDIALQLTDRDAERAPIWESMAAAANHHSQPDRAYDLAMLALDEARANGADEDEDRVVALVGDISVSTRREGATDLLRDHLEQRNHELSNDHLVQVASKLAHTLMQESRMVESLEVAERCLVAAERRRLWPILIDTLITKSVDLSSVPRPEEALILLQGAIEMADKRELLDQAIRGRINLTYLTFNSDPLVAQKDVREALELAKLAGNISLAHFCLNNMIADQYRVGDRDQIAAILDDPLQASMDGWSLAGRQAYESLLACLDGDFEHASRLAEAAGNGLERASVGLSEVMRLLFMDDPSVAFESTIEYMEGQVEFYRHSLEHLGNVVAITGDRSHLDRLIAIADVHPGHHTLVTQQPRSFVSAVEGNSGPARAVVDEYTSISWNSTAIFTLAGAANFLPGGHPDARPMFEEALGRAEQHGWRGLRDLVAINVTL